MSGPQQKTDYTPVGEDVGALVLDVGSAYTRFGYAGEDTPRQLWASVAGRVVNDNTHNMSDGILGSGTRSGDFGGDIVPNSKRQKLSNSLTTPVPPSLFPLDFYHLQNDVEVVPCLRRTFNPKNNNYTFDIDCHVFELMLSNMTGPRIGLSTNLKGYPILLSEPNMQSPNFRIHATETLFEEFEIEALYLAKSAVLAAFAVGRSSGCVADIGASGISIVPVQDGYTLQRSILEFDVGGNMMDDYFTSLLAERKHVVDPIYAYRDHIHDTKRGELAAARADLSAVHPSYLRYSQLAVVRYLKENVSKCLEDSRDVPNFTAAAVSPNATKYVLPDETPLESADYLGVLVPELLFSPDTVQKYFGGSPGYKFAGFQGLPHSIVACINRCDHDIRRELYSSIILTGGVSTIPGLPERLAKTFQEDLSGVINTKHKFAAPSSTAERRFSGWVGGSILASLATFQQLWLSRMEYEEHGPNIVERKCRQ